MSSRAASSAQLTQRDGVIDNVRDRPGSERARQLRGARRSSCSCRPTISSCDSSAMSRTLDSELLHAELSCASARACAAPARQFPALAAGLGYAPPSTDVYDRLSDIDAPLHVDTQDGGVSLIADWNLGANTLTSVTALALLGLGRCQRSRLHRHSDSAGPAHPVAPGSIQPGTPPRLERRRRASATSAVSTSSSRRSAARPPASTGRRPRTGC